jgi:protocatechuate 3,4-dioxygenase beta subunit
MRTVIGLLVFLGLVAAVLFWPAPEVAPPDDAPPKVAPKPDGAIVGRVSLHGFPVVATLEARRIRGVGPTEGTLNEWHHTLGFLYDDSVGRGDPVGTAASDAEGNFRIEGLPPAEYHVTARTADGATGQWKLDVGAPGEIVRATLEIEATGHTLFGRLRWSDGRPFRGTISVGHRGVETSPDGRFALTDLPRAAFPIAICEPGVLYRIVGDLDFTEMEIDVVVDEGFVTQEGHAVAAEDGAGLGGIPVIMAGGQPSGRGCFSATRSRPDGSFTVRGHAGARLVVGGGDRYTLWRDISVPVDSAVFKLERRPLVTGRVVDGQGRPVEGAPVWLYDLPTDSDGTPGHEWRSPVLSDESGRFRFTSIRTGSVMVAVFGDGWISRDLPRGSPSRYNPLALDLARNEKVEVELVVVPSPSVTGRVTDHEGNPVAGQRIHLWEDMEHDLENDFWGKWLDEDPIAITGPDGRYRFPTVSPRIPQRVTIYPPVGENTESDWFWPAGETTVDLSLPEPPRRWVEVRVLSEKDGSPVPEARVSIEPVADADRFYGSDAATGPDGRALVGPLPPGALLAAVHQRAHLPRRDISVPGSGGVADRLNLEIRMKPGAVLGGKVLMPDGTPARRPSVQILDGRATAAQASFGSSGGFVFRYLEPGTYLVRAWLYGPDRTYFHAECEAETDRENLVLTLEQTPPGHRDPKDDSRPQTRVAGRVFDPEGRPVRGVRVRTDEATWTDAEGRFALRCRDGETVELRADGPPHLFLRDPVFATAGSGDVEIRMARAAEPLVTVLDWAGRPVTRTAVTVVPPEPAFEDERVTRVTDAEGRVRFGGLDPERPLVLTVDPPDDREDLAETEFEDWLPADRTIRLEGIRTLTGIVRDADGFGVGNASLWWRKAGATGEGWEEIDVEDDGSFTAEELSAVKLELLAGLFRTELDDKNLVSVTVPPGHSPVEIEVDGGTWIGLRVPRWPSDATARASLSWRGGARNLDMPASGRIRFHGLPENKTFTLHASLPGGKMVYATKLAPNVDHELSLEQGHTISGKIVAPEPVDVFAISVYSHRIALHDLEDDETPNDRYRIDGLPEDEYLISILASSKAVRRRSYKGEVRVRTGEPTDLKLELWKK